MSDLESRFTRESSFCPHPEHWHSPDSEATEDEISALIGALITAIQPEFVVETGTYHGHTAIKIGAALYSNNHGRLVTLEKDRENWKKATAWINANWSFLPITALNINSLEYVPDQDIDFAFFDSWQEGRFYEFMSFYEEGRLKRDAIVAFHDTAPHHQVMQYVNSLEEQGYIKTITIHSPRGFTLAQVL